MSSPKRMPAASNLVRVLLCVLAGILLQGCAQLPPLADRTTSSVIRDTDDTRLGKAVAPVTGEHAGRSGVLPLTSGRDAFAVRILLAAAADRTLDVQYYIWHGDLSGTLLFDALRKAAERGVRVRLLLDDNGTAGLDEILAALDSHPNIEVRLFNPFVTREWRAMGFLSDFERLNRRMHNKSFTADNRATVIGGRNIGDEYFEAGDDVLFVDLDVLAVGPVVEQVSTDFDRYWASGSSYPADRVLPAVRPERLSELAGVAADFALSPAATAYTQAVATAPFVHDLLAGRLSFEWTEVAMVSDDPAKGLGLAEDSELLWGRLKRVMGRPEKEFEVVSPYFVPAEDGMAFFSSLASSGVKVSVLTNSLAATDVAAVHAGYAKWRKPLLEAGVDLYEMKRTAQTQPAKDRSGGSGGSGSSLHAKTFSVDNDRVFIGSLNFDPRSARLNTEMGFVIHSPVLARSITRVFETKVPDLAYRVRLDAAGNLQWIDRVDGTEQVYDTEPQTGFWQRFGVSILSWLPIDWLL